MISKLEKDSVIAQWTKINVDLIESFETLNFLFSYLWRASINKKSNNWWELLPIPAWIKKEKKEREKKKNQCTKQFEKLCYRKETLLILATERNSEVLSPMLNISVVSIHNNRETICKRYIISNIWIQLYFPQNTHCHSIMIGHHIYP